MVWSGAGQLVQFVQQAGTASRRQNFKRSMRKVETKFQRSVYALRGCAALGQKPTRLVHQGGLDPQGNGGGILRRCGGRLRMHKAPASLATQIA